jgi:metacaspase-1
MQSPALCIGINYEGTDHALRGCHNDANDWKALLEGKGFSPDLLLGKDATLENMVAGIRRVIAGAKAGQTAVITYSGHGTWVPDTSGDEDDGRDEAVVPADFGEDGRNLLIDDDIRVMFNAVAPGATALFVTDSCHSGTVFRFMPGVFEDAAHPRVRFIPPSHFIRDKKLRQRMERAFGQNNHSAASSAPLPGLVHYSGCKDTEYSSDAYIGKRYCGAFSYFATRSFLKGGTYLDVWRDLRASLPSREFQQTPLLNALPALKRLKALG